MRKALYTGEGQEMPIRQINIKANGLHRGRTKNTPAQIKKKRLFHPDEAKAELGRQTRYVAEAKLAHKEAVNAEIAAIKSGASQAHIDSLSEYRRGIREILNLTLDNFRRASAIAKKAKR